MENIRQSAVSVFSPPDSSPMFLNLFPGGSAIISIFDSNTSSASARMSSALPPSNIS